MRRYPYEDEMAATVGDAKFIRIIEELCDVICGGKSDLVSVLDHDRHDAINSQGSATFEHEGKEYFFSWINGNNDGTHVVGFENDYVPPKRQKRIFVVDRYAFNSQESYERAVKLKEAGVLRAKIAEMENAMNYDMYFDPSSKTKKYYDDWLKQHKLCVEWSDK